MNLPTEIAPLEAELNRLLSMYDEDEKRLAQSATPEIHRIFFASTKKLRHELEERLRRAKAERRYHQYEAVPPKSPECAHCSTTSATSR